MRLEVHPDKTNSDGQCEEIIDYILSFTFRMAIDSNNRKILQDECRKILFYFLGFKSDEEKNIQITRVSPTKQWNKIDLIVDVEFLRNNIVENHCILIETKYYSKLKNNLGEYEKYAKDFKYPIEQERPRIMHYWVFHCRSNQDASEYTAHLPMNYGIVNKQFFENRIVSETESEIFNEFWINNWQTNSFEEIPL